MKKLTDRQLAILQRITEMIDTEKYFSFDVKQFSGGIYLMPDEPRWIGDNGEFMGETFELAKYNIGVFCEELQS